MTLDVETPVGGWDTMLAGVSEDRLLLIESAHRVNNEVAAAIAALRMVRPARGSKARWRLVGSCLERLEGFAAVNRVLALPTTSPVRLSQEMVRLCVGLGAARRGIGASRIETDVGDVVIDGASARRVLLVAAELVQNAIRHALEGRDGCLRVVLRLDARDVVLGVKDDGPGMSATSATRGGGMGSPLVAELVRRAGGVMECRTGREGTTFQVAIPHAAAPVGGTGFD